MTPSILPANTAIGEVQVGDHFVCQAGNNYREPASTAIVRFAQMINDAWKRGIKDIIKPDHHIITVAMDDNCGFWIPTPTSDYDILCAIPMLNCDYDQVIYKPWYELMEIVAIDRLLADGKDVFDADTAVPDFKDLVVDTDRRRLQGACYIWFFDFDRFDSPFWPILTIKRDECNDHFYAEDVDLPFYDAEVLLKRLSQCGLFRLTLDYDTNLLTQRYRKAH